MLPSSLETFIFLCMVVVMRPCALVLFDARYCMPDPPFLCPSWSSVNFMKNDKNYDGKSSDVLRMVQEMDREPQQPETPGTPTNILGTPDRPVVQGHSFKILQRAFDDEGK